MFLKINITFNSTLSPSCMLFMEVKTVLERQLHSCILYLQLLDEESLSLTYETIFMLNHLQDKVKTRMWFLNCIFIEGIYLDHFACWILYIFIKYKFIKMFLLVMWINLALSIEYCFFNV